MGSMAVPSQHGTRAFHRSAAHAPRTSRRAEAEASYVERALGLALLFVLVVGCALVLAPFFTAILLAVTLCVSTWPLFRRVERALGGRRNLTASIMTALAALVLLGPLALFAAHIVDDVVRIAALVRAAFEAGTPAPAWLAELPLVGGAATRTWNDLFGGDAALGAALAPRLAPLRDWALRQGGAVLSAAFQVAATKIKRIN